MEYVIQRGNEIAECLSLYELAETMATVDLTSSGYISSISSSSEYPELPKLVKKYKANKATTAKFHMIFPQNLARTIASQ